MEIKETLSVNPAQTGSGGKKIEYVPKTLFQILLTQFLQHRFAVISLGVIVFFVVVALMAPVISFVTGIYPNQQDMYNRYKPPFTRTPFTTEIMELSVERFLKKSPKAHEQIVAAIRSEPGIDTSSIDFEESAEMFLITLHDQMTSDSVYAVRIAAISSKPLQKFVRMRENFSINHLLGTDELGRDVLIRLIYGARVSIGVGVIVAFAGALIGLLVGCCAGFYGGILDSVLMRVTDSLLSLPLLPVMIVLCAIDLKSIPIFKNMFTASSESIFKLIFVLTAFSWMSAARLVRGCILSLKEQEFIQAARTLGAKSGFIIFVHIIPNVLAPLLVEVTLKVGQSILSEAALSFLGLGIQPPVPSWGNMLLNAIEIVYNAPTLAIFPGLLILIVVVSFNYFGDGLQDAVNPHSIRR